MNYRGEYNKSFLGSVLLHSALLIFLLFSLDSPIVPSSVPPKSGEAIEAVMLDEAQINEEVARLENEQKKQKLVEEKRQTELEQKAEQARKVREQEQARLEKLTQDMAELQKKEQDQLNNIKLAQEKERKKLQELQEKEEKEKKRLAQIEEQRAEKQRMREMQFAKEKEQKKRAEKEKQLTDAKHKAEEKRIAGIKAAKLASERVAAEKDARIASDAERFLRAWADQVKLNKLLISELPANTETVVEINILPDASIRPRIFRSSGNAAFDDRNIKAVLKTPFNFPEDPLIKEKVKEIARSFKLALDNRAEGEY